MDQVSEGMRERPTSSPMLRVELTRNGSEVRVAVTGELDISTVQTLRDALISQRVPGRQILLDLSGLSFMDSTGLQALLEADAAARADGHLLSITSLSRSARRVLEVSGTLDRLPIVDPTAGGPSGDCA